MEAQLKMENNGQSRDKVVQPLSMHPGKFALWLFIISITMIFASLTSSYIVRMGEGNWLDFELPTIFWINSGIILFSSITMHFAYLSAKRNNIKTVRIAMLVTTLLGVAFLYGQYVSWQDLIADHVYFSDPGTPSGSFVYVFTGLHAFHIITGIIYLIVTTSAAFSYKVHSKNMDKITMCATYWHFLGALWIYLFLFLLMNH